MTAKLTSGGAYRLESFAIDHFLMTAKRARREVDPRAGFAIDHFLMTAKRCRQAVRRRRSFAIDHFLMTAKRPSRVALQAAALP